MKRSLLAFLALALCSSWSLAASVEVKEPVADQQLKGMVKVLVSVDELPEPKVAFVGLSGVWYQLSGEGTEMTADVDTTLSPNGKASLIVATGNKKVKAIVPVEIKNPLNVYFADLHSHTSYSDGTLLPSVAHEYACNTAELDVFCLTDHLEYVDDAEWYDTREVAWKANEDGKFVSFPGLEWTTKWGHLNIFDPKERVWPKDPQEFYAAAAKAKVVTKFNHPGDGSKTHSGLEYSEIGDKTVQLMEVRRDVEEQALIRALDKGWHIAPEGSDDTHSANWGNVRSWTGILAPGLSKRNILDALAARHVYSTLDRNLTLQFNIGDAVMGDIVSEPMEAVQVKVLASDPDESDTIAKIELFEDGKVAQTSEPNEQQACWYLSCAPPAGSHYFFAKVTQADGNVAWSAPIWVTVKAAEESDNDGES